MAGARRKHKAPTLLQASFSALPYDANNDQIAPQFKMPMPPRPVNARAFHAETRPNIICLYTPSTLCGAKVSAVSKRTPNATGVKNTGSSPIANARLQTKQTAILLHLARDQPSLDWFMKADEGNSTDQPDKSGAASKKRLSSTTTCALP